MSIRGTAMSLPEFRAVIRQFNAGARGFGSLMAAASAATKELQQMYMAYQSLGFRVGPGPEGIKYFAYCDRIGCLGVCDADGTGQRDSLAPVTHIVILDEDDRPYCEIPV